MLALLSLAALAQEQPAENNKNQPQVRVNYLNVCTPSTDEQQEIRKALASVPAARFTRDFEISRGQTSVPDAPLASYVRVRHEFAAAAPFVAAQYSLSYDEKSTVEDLVFRSREAKDVIEVQLEDTITGAQDPKAVLATDTPVDRVKLERFGKSSVVLAQCPSVDQSAYQPLLEQASELMARYRVALGTKRLVPRELAALGVGAKPAAAKPAAKSKK
jgi:hypothetical protein